MKKILLSFVISLMIVDISIANLTEREKFDNLSKEISNWGRWGENDQLGTLNNISDISIIKARKLVIEGKTISLSRNMSKDSKALDTVEAGGAGVKAGFNLLLPGDIK